jgi:hypothetical protein
MLGTAPAEHRVRPRDCLVSGSDTLRGGGMQSLARRTKNPALSQIFLRGH